MDKLARKRQRSRIRSQRYRAVQREIRNEVQRFATENSEPIRNSMLIISALKRFSIDIRNNTVAINELRDALVNNGVIATSSRATIESFESDYDLQLPYETLEEFEGFDSQLGNDGACMNYLVLALRQLLDRSNNMTKSCTTIFKKFFKQQLAMAFTAKKKMEGKTVLRSTNFCRCLIDTCTAFHTHPDGTPVQEDDVLKAIGQVISNAKDWNGRHRRGPKS